MERFNEVLGTEMDKIFFFYKQFLIAYEKKAIDTLIFTDGYIRKITGVERKELNKKIQELKSGTVEVCQFSSLHTTGEKVDEFGGIVGILKYVMPELSEVEEEEDEENKKKGSTNLEEEIKDENLMDLINDNLVNYNPDKEDEDEKEKKKKKGKKKTKQENKNISQQRKKNQRKRSSFDDNDDYEDDVY